jgi:hypothetical protein
MAIEIQGNMMINQWMEWVIIFRYTHIMGISWKWCKKAEMEQRNSFLLGFLSFSWVAESTACLCFVPKFGAAEAISFRSWSHFYPFLVQNGSASRHFYPLLPLKNLNHLGRSVLTRPYSQLLHESLRLPWERNWTWRTTRPSVLLSWTKLATCEGGGLM